MAHRWTVALLIVACAAVANAQNTAPDPSAELFVKVDPPPVRFDLPGIWDVKTPFFTLPIPYIPLRMPLKGSVPGRTSEMPDAFALNHVSFPCRSHCVSETRELAEALLASSK